MQKLSSGLRINSAADDAAGLSISEKMKAQVRGLHQGSRNAQDGISMLQAAEGALKSTQSMLQRMRELSVEASNDTYVTKDRNAIQSEMNQLKSEINRVSTDTEFNTQKLFDGTTKKVQFQVGANKNQVINFTFEAINTKTLGDPSKMIPVGTVGGAAIPTPLIAPIPPKGSGAFNNIASLKVDTAGNAEKSIGTLDTAINQVSNVRANLGAVQNRLTYAINNDDNAAMNLTAAQSRITDVNMAQEMVEFTKDNILQQAAQAMLGQANQQPQSILQLLR